MFDSVLSPRFKETKTAKFSCYETDTTKHNSAAIFLDMNCYYAADVINQAIFRRPWCTVVDELASSGDEIVQISDFENIEWEPVLQGKHKASSYIVRKGLSRKAQFALQMKRYVSKHPTSIIKSAIPFTLILETWGAFEEMKLDLGVGVTASLDAFGGSLRQASLRQRLQWCLEDAVEEITHSDRLDWLWILKPSVTNKGTNISVIEGCDELLDALEESPDIREWVLQRYITNPLTIGGHKFHLRVYVLCVGALQVFVYQHMLALLAAHRYNEADLEDCLSHLTNTARGIEDETFDEEKFVLLFGDLAARIQAEHSEKLHHISAEEVVRKIRSDINEITGEVFAAYESEYTVFSPMENCFELFGLDFMVDDAFGVTLLEVNPGPDVKQTGNRLRGLISALWEDTCAVVIDKNESVSGFEKVYDKEWSAAAMKGGGMTLT